MAILHDSDTRLTTSLPRRPTRTPRWPAFALVRACMQPPAGIEPATPSLPPIGGQAPC